MTDTLEHPTPTGGITVTPLSTHTGALISGVDIARPVAADAVDAIQGALDRWRVVFFRDQDLDHAAQIAFGRHFGELTYAHPHDDTPPDGYPEIYTVDTRRFQQQYGLTNDDNERVRRQANANGWHTDVTPAVNPPAGSILRADVVPAYGGDTTFTSLVAAYEGLADPIKQLVDGLRAEHLYGANPSGYKPRLASWTSRIEKNRLVARHPVVRVHPRTGERALFVNPVFTDNIVDLSPQESRWLLEYLFAQIARPEYTVRFHWEPGSVAFWDNRATAHLGPQDVPADVERVLHRVTLIGDVPVGPDGRTSELIEGEPFRSTPIFTPAST
jgi:taurine dioxygenase